MTDRATVGDIYHRALVLWGEEAQSRMAQEECAELIAAINQCTRGRIHPYMPAREIADVEIMCAQMRLIVGAEVVDKAKAEKLHRLQERIEDAERDNVQRGE